jgi:transposase
VINQIRSFLLERGIAVRQGPRFLRRRLPEILAKRIDVLSPRMIGIIEDLGGDWRHLDERIERVTEEIEQLAHGSESCRQLMTARVILLRPANWARHSFGPWLTAAAKRLHHNVLATALANKLARIAWTVLAQRRDYETRVVTETA